MILSERLMLGRNFSLHFKICAQETSWTGDYSHMCVNGISQFCIHFFRCLCKDGKTKVQAPFDVPKAYTCLPKKVHTTRYRLVILELLISTHYFSASVMAATKWGQCKHMAAGKVVTRAALTPIICTARTEHIWVPTVLWGGYRRQREIDGMRQIQPRDVPALMELCQGHFFI